MPAAASVVAVGGKLKDFVSCKEVTTPPPSPPLHWPTGVVCSHIGKSSHSDPLEVFTVHTLEIPHTACWIIASKVFTHREGRAVATPTLSMCSTLRIASAYTVLPNIYASPLNPQSHFDVGFWQIWASLLLLMVCPPDLGKVYKLNGASVITFVFLATRVTVALKSKPSPY